MAGSLVYPFDFVERVIAEYPDWGEIHDRLRRNDSFAGRYLDDSSSGGFNPNTIIEFIENGGEEGVQTLLSQAKRQLRRRELYGEWCRIMDEAREEQVAPHRPR